MSFPCGQNLTCSDYRKYEGGNCKGKIRFDVAEIRYHAIAINGEDQNCAVTIKLNRDMEMQKCLDKLVEDK